MAVPVGSVADFTELPEAAMDCILDFLHALNLAGPPTAAARKLAAACSSPKICQQVVRRDLRAEESCWPWRKLPERNEAVAAQQRRPWLQGVCRERSIDMDGAEGVAVQGLRDFVATLRAGMPWKAVLRHTACLAAQEGRPALLSWAARKGAPAASVKEEAGEPLSSLMLAARCNRPATVVVAAAFCDIEQQHPRFGTALHMAAFTGARQAVVQLIRLGASLDVFNRTFLQTPLHVACSRDHEHVVRRLVRAQAECSLRDKDGLTALGVCRFMRSSRAARTLELFVG